MESLFTHGRLEDFLIIEEMLLKNKLLIDPIDMDSDHPYRLVNYSLEAGTQFQCLLDRNVVSYLIALVQGQHIRSNKIDDCYRLTAALQAFLNAADILSEPSMAYHEYMETSGIDNADNELALFRAADNLNPNIYLDIALGLRSFVKQSEVGKFKNGELKSVDMPPKLRHFEANIVFLKKALSLKSQDLSDYNVLLNLVDWIYEEYIFSAPSFHFLSIYFSSKRISKMLKSHSMADIRNATWDLCFIQHLITLINKNENTRWIFSTFDKAIKATANLVFVKYNETDDDYYSRLERIYAEMWGKKNNYGRKLLKKYADFSCSINDAERNIVRFNGSSEYILKIREEVDKEFRESVRT